MESLESGLRTRPCGSVLIVEDEWIIADEMRRILVAGGYTVAGIARTAQEFVARAKETTPSLVLLDLHLAGGEDGIDVATRVCEFSPVPVVIVSGQSDAETVARTVRAIRPAGFVVKPFSAAQLLATVALAFAHADTTADAAQRDFSGASPAAVQSALEKIASALAGLGIERTRPEVDAAPSLRNLPELDELSAREREVVEQMARHRRVSWVARVLGISEHTVRNHLKAIYWKLDVHSQDELLARVLDVHPSSRRAKP